MNRKVVIIAITVIAIAIACTIGYYSYKKMQIRKASITGYIQSKEMDEISGIAASGIFRDVYYVHNDQGDTSRFFAISHEGRLYTTFYYTRDTGIPNWQMDCEDIAVGPGPAPGKSYVYVGDVGDNGCERDYVTIYRFEEDSLWLKDTIRNAVAVQLHLKYPDWPRDAEALMIDPVEQLLYIIN
ncbi:MAG: hypothetical protein JWQ38_3429, partial [Flavipsychrobacter sp.]|nr:hypothetical protein [Flavipsychrobacter sp.]